MSHKFFLTSSLFFHLLAVIIIISSCSISSLSFFYHTYSDKNNIYSYHYQLVYAAAGAGGAKSFTVVIPKGSANPEVDITKLGPRQWYLPRQITIHTNDTITWKNDDTEAHTVTSGVSAGIESLMNNKRGIPNGIFDSGAFKPGQSWKHTFTNPGTYTYFCTIHPWMEGVVLVQGGQVQKIPSYPVDASGKQISNLPIYHFTSDGNLEVGLSWDPNVLLTGKEISFFVSFFDRANNKPNLLPYDFVLMQNGKQLERIPSITQIGMNVQHFVFPNSGPTIIRIENVGGTKSSFTEFNTTVYDNPSISSAAVNQLAAQYKAANRQSNNPFVINSLTLVYISYGVIFGIPAAVGVTYFLYRKGVI